LQVELGFYNNSAIFRVVPAFVAQWGISGDPALNAEWGERSIADDPVLGFNTVGTIAFAAAPSPNTRTTEVYVNLGNNTGLDSQGFAVFGRVTQGLGVLQQFAVSNISQSVYTTRGNSWVHQAYPDVNFITGMSLDEPLVPSVAVGVPTLSPTAGFPGGCDGSGSGAGPGGGTDGCVEANCSGANPPVQCALWCAACVPTITATCADIVCGGTCLVQNGVPICLTEAPTLTPTDQPTAPPVDPTTAPTTAVMRTEQAQNNAASAAASVGAFLIVVVGGMCLLNQCRSSETDASKYTAVGLTEELTPPGWDSEDEMEPTAYRGQTATTAL
jgi:cyclophilin family peptidyl-prolyl cis-trans isomerase